MRNEQFIVIEGWMVNELGLKGNELLIYAIIYGFSQEEGHFFRGSLGYLADWTNTSKQTVMNTLKSLLEKDLIGKQEVSDGVYKKFVYYTKILYGGIQKSLPGGIQKSLPNNIDINNINNNIVRIVEAYTESEMLREALIYFVSETRKKMKKPVTPKALELLLKKLDELGKTDEDKTAVVNQSIMRSWQSFYELKDDGYRPRPATNVGTTGVHFEQEREHNYDDDDIYFDPAGGIV